MGHWLAKFYWILGEDVMQTPNIRREGHKHRILNLDPRSPSYAIPRTPIEVDSTPERGDEAGSITRRTGVQITKKAGGLRQRFMQKQTLASTE
ncbi:unnamed protein product [Toxocara canis]|uniref:Uncharacterized protein n=1 Tax=Toxocara canis TaxID=6265 RepID=A0A183UJE0_TOXCA|nr:unnamed protein product [Toxocara canis]